MIKQIIKDKRGASLEGWTTAGVGIIILIFCLGIVVVSMNHDYGHTYDPTFGMTSNSTQTMLNNLPGVVGNGTQGAVTTNDINGLSMPSLYGMFMAALGIVGDIATGQWITNAVALLQLGAAGIR